MIKKIYRYFYKKIVGKINPSKYAKKIGVNFTKDLFIYGNISWGTEPWLITLGENVHITNGVQFITHDGGTLLFRNIIPDLEITKPITIGNNVYIGVDCKILPGVNIGNNVVIGAGSIVTKNVPDDCVVAGVPARKIKSIDDYLEKIKNESLHVGNLKGKTKDEALKEIFNYKGKSKGIYF